MCSEKSKIEKLKNCVKNCNIFTVICRFERKTAFFALSVSVLGNCSIVAECTEFIKCELEIIKWKTAAKTESNSSNNNKTSQLNTVSKDKQKQRFGKVEKSKCCRWKWPKTLQR